jgi:predicted murein hydrolase (TIGR00659 family)
MDWKEFILQNEVVLVAITLLIYLVSEKLQQKTRFILLNPILISIVIIVAILSAFNIQYPVYYQGGRYIEFFLKPAIVALGVPLYQQLDRIKKQAFSIIVSQLAGCLAGIVSVVLVARLMGASKEIIYSLAPKSVTTPIAIEISKSIGGIPPLTASVVIVVGIFGAIFGYRFMKWVKISNNISQSLSMGTAAHAIGTARSVGISPAFGAMSGIGLIVNGIFTALLTPSVLRLLERWIGF